MSKRIEVRALTQEESEQLKRWSKARTIERRLADRAEIILLSHEGMAREAIRQRIGCSEMTILRWVKSFNAKGINGLDDAPRPGGPLKYSEEERGQIVNTARTHPQQLDRPYSHWTLNRLTEYINKHLGIGISRAQLGRVLEDEGLRWYQEETYFTERPDPQFAVKRGR